MFEKKILIAVLVLLLGHFPRASSFGSDVFEGTYVPDVLAPQPTLIHIVEWTEVESTIMTWGVQMFTHADGGGGEASLPMWYPACNPNIAPCGPGEVNTLGVPDYRIHYLSRIPVAAMYLMIGESIAFSYDPDPFFGVRRLWYSADAEDAELEPPAATSTQAIEALQ